MRQLIRRGGRGERRWSDLVSVGPARRSSPRLATQGDKTYRIDRVAVDRAAASWRVCEVTVEGDGLAFRFVAAYADEHDAEGLVWRLRAIEARSRAEAGGKGQ